jgi:glycosyltransferase involved in cell wall biosynthesis
MRPRIAVLAAVSSNGEKGGAERFFMGLRDALVDADMAAELVEVVSDERNFDRVKETYLRFYDLDLREFDGVISSKAPSYAVRHPNHVCYLLHTMRIFYDMFDHVFPRPRPELREQRRFIQSLDTAALQRPEIRRLFAIGQEVATRLRNFNGIDAEVMHHPSSLAGLHGGAFKYLFLPGRLHPWKRVDLAIEAMRHVVAPVELIISGTGEDESRLKRLAKGGMRVRFVGRVADEQLVQLYSDALAVLFMPRNEDLGLVTLEAFRCSKPVITCADSGEPARLVQNGESGYVCSPDPRQIAVRIEQLVRMPALAETMGRKGAASIAPVTWQRVAATLIDSLGFSSRQEPARASS